MNEVLNHNLKFINSSLVLSRLDLVEHNYFVVSSHREENIDNDSNFYKLIALLNSLAETYLLPIIVSAHPRTMKRIANSSVPFHELVRPMKPLGFHDYVNLQLNSKAVLSDSGTISEESSILNFPALNIREAHERPEGMEEASVMLVGLDIERVHQGLSILNDQGRHNARTIFPVSDYTIPNVSEKIVRIIHSYTDYINRVTWKNFN